VSWVCGGANNCTTCENPMLADSAHSAYIGLKDVFCGVCIEKGARSFVGEK